MVPPIASEMAEIEHRPTGLFVLHAFHFSLYSIVVRFTAVLGAKIDPTRELDMELKLVDIHRREQLSERYMTRVNPKGQVRGHMRTAEPVR